MISDELYLDIKFKCFGVYSPKFHVIVLIDILFALKLVLFMRVMFWLLSMDVLIDESLLLLVDCEDFNREEKEDETAQSIQSKYNEILNKSNNRNDNNIIIYRSHSDHLS